jgi:cyclase
MLKKRIIFILFYQDGFFHLSRNFRLQRVGNCDWLLEKFRFLSIGDFIDELIILDVSRDRDSIGNNELLKSDVKKLMKKIFVPLTIGGGIKNVDDASVYFQIGADKISINSEISTNPELLTRIASKFGSQAVVASLDARLKNSQYNVYAECGEKNFGLLAENMNLAQRKGAGEIIITSIDMDGTAAGLDMNMLNNFPDLDIPIIACGGGGMPEHFYNALLLPNISGVATGNLFNFIGSGFYELRKELCNQLPNLRNI